MCGGGGCRLPFDSDAAYRELHTHSTLPRCYAVHSGVMSWLLFAALLLPLLLHIFSVEC